jgi:hypothetical protein
MDKISADFQAEMRANANDLFEVLITLTEGYTAESIKLEGAKSLMKNIIQAKLPVNGINRIAKNKNVVAIEKDSSMGVM